MDPHHLKPLVDNGIGVLGSNPKLYKPSDAQDILSPLGSRLLQSCQPLSRLKSNDSSNCKVVAKGIQSSQNFEGRGLEGQAAGKTKISIFSSRDPLKFSLPQEAVTLTNGAIESSSLRYHQMCEEQPALNQPLGELTTPTDVGGTDRPESRVISLDSKFINDLSPREDIVRLLPNVDSGDVFHKPKKNQRRKRNDLRRMKSDRRSSVDDLLKIAPRTMEVSSPVADKPADWLTAAMLLQDNCDLEVFSHEWQLKESDKQALQQSLIERVIPYHSSDLYVATVVVDFDPVLDDPEQLTAEVDDGPDKERSHVFWELQLEQQESLKKFTLESKDVIIDPDVEIPYGEAKFPEFSIELTQGADNMLRKQRMRPFPVKGSKYELLQRTVEQMTSLKKGFMSTAIYASPCFFARRRRSDKLRLCTAHNILNDVTIEERFVLPTVDDITRLFRGKKYFSLIDLKSAYNQVRLSKFAQRYCGMILPWGIFINTVLNFGLKNAPAFFQRNISSCLAKGIKDGFVMVFIDDIIIFSDTFEEHLLHLNYVMSCLREFNLKASADKVHLFLSQLKVLGLICNGKGITTDKERIQDMMDYPKPKSPTQIRRFIGLVGSYRNFIKDFNLLAEPLIKLTSKNCTVPWGREQDNSFHKLKDAVITSPCLVYPNPNKSMRMQIDGSITGGGSVLLQLEDDGYWHPVGFASWLYNLTQRRYSTTDRETLPLIFSLQKWRDLVVQRRANVLGDHKPMPKHVNQHDPHGRYARWQSMLHGWGLTFDYIKGVQNLAPDALTRVGEEDDFADVDQFVTGVILQTMQKTLPIEHQQFVTATLLAEPGSRDLAHWEVAIALHAQQALPKDPEWSLEQRKDPFLQPYFAWLENSGLPGDNKKAKELLKDIANFALVGEHKVLVRTLTDPSKPVVNVKRVVPDSLKKAVLSLYHDSVWSGAHLGREKTYNRISRDFFWLGMRAYVNLYVRTCTVCQLFKKNPKNDKTGFRSQSKLGHLETSDFWDLVSIDIWGPVKTSKRSNSYLLTVVDGFTNTL